MGIESEFRLDLYFLTAENVSSELFVAVKKSSKFGIYSPSKPVLEGLFSDWCIAIPIKIRNQN